MIHHLVLWKLKDFAEGKSKQDNAVLMREKLESLRQEIPGIRELRVGINLPSEFSNCDVALHSYFSTFGDLRAYQMHPKHQEVSEWIGKVREFRSAVDYEF